MLSGWCRFHLSWCWQLNHTVSTLTLSKFTILTCRDLQSVSCGLEYNPTWRSCRRISLQARSFLRASFIRSLSINTGDPYILQCVLSILTTSLSFFTQFYSSAIVAFTLLFSTFAIGLRCFSDFDKGLQSSKVHGQSYRPVANPRKADLFGN